MSEKAAREDRPLLEIYQLVAGGVPPQRAGRSAAGTLPSRAMRYCEPASEASGFGWYLFLPRDFTVLFDGIEAFARFDEEEDFFPLAHGAQWPWFADQFSVVAPERVRDYSPPALVFVPAHQLLQIWSGCLARTAPNWSLLVRAPANIYGLGGGYQHLEGIIETDTWFGPLFSNVRLTATDRPVTFRADWPFIQLQPVRREHYNDACLERFRVRELEELSDADWADYYETTVRKSRGELPIGSYAVTARKRRSKERL